MVDSRVYVLDKASKKPLLGQLVMGGKVFFFSPRVVKIKYKHMRREHTEHLQMIPITV